MRLSRINTILLLLIVAINGYVIVAPFVPALLFSWQSHHGKQQQLTSDLDLAKPVSGVSNQSSLIIPSMLLSQPILEGPVSDMYHMLDQGVWRWPLGSTPASGGNTILIGHRFTYTNPRGVFYFLNKVQLGDQIGVDWQAKQYLYKVTTIEQVPPSDTAIENNTHDAQLTIFTCTPLWLPKNRLVVIAQLTKWSSLP